MAYGKDYRKRALELVTLGKSRQEVCALLAVSESSLKRWTKREAAGWLATQYPATRGSYKIDEDQLRQYVKGHPDAYIYEIADAINARPSTVGDVMKRLALPRKKRPRNTGNGTQKNEMPITRS